MSSAITAFEGFAKNLQILKEFNRVILHD